MTSNIAPDLASGNPYRRPTIQDLARLQQDDDQPDDDPIAEAMSRAAWLPRPFLCGLPLEGHRKARTPGTVWSRRNGGDILVLAAREGAELPAGRYPLDALMLLAAEARDQHGDRIILGRWADMMRAAGMLAHGKKASGGATGNLTKWRQAVRSLFGCDVFSVRIRKTMSPTLMEEIQQEVWDLRLSLREGLPIPPLQHVQHLDWRLDDTTDQIAVILSDAARTALTRSCVLLDRAVLDRLPRQSTASVQLYAWLADRVFGGRFGTVPVPSLVEQIGSTSKKSRDSHRTVRDALQAVQQAWPTLRARYESGVMEVSHPRLTIMPTSRGTMPTVGQGRPYWQQLDPADIAEYQVVTPAFMSAYSGAYADDPDHPYNVAAEEHERRFHGEAHLGESVAAAFPVIERWQRRRGVRGRSW
jgi:hypothetical protein